MKRNIISIAAAGVLATAISVLAAGSPAASDCRQNGFRGYTLKPFCCNISNYENHLSIK